MDVHLDGRDLQFAENAKPAGGCCMKHAETAQNGPAHLSKRWTDDYDPLHKGVENVLLSIAGPFF